MHVVYIQCPEPVDVNVSREHGQRVVERLLMRSPVVPVLPPLDESFDVGEGDAVFPPCIFELVGKVGEFEFPMEEIEFLVWNGNRERCFGHGDVDREI